MNKNKEKVNIYLLNFEDINLSLKIMLYYIRETFFKKHIIIYIIFIFL